MGQLTLSILNCDDIVTTFNHEVRRKLGGNVGGHCEIGQGLWGRSPSVGSSYKAPAGNLESPPEAEACTTGLIMLSSLFLVLLFLFGVA